MVLLQQTYLDITTMEQMAYGLSISSSTLYPYVMARRLSMTILPLPVFRRMVQERILMILQLLLSMHSLDSIL